MPCSSTNHECLSASPTTLDQGSAYAQEARLRRCEARLKRHAFPCRPAARLRLRRPGARTPEALAAELEQRGAEPVAFVIEQPERHELLLFDDGLHSAVEPSSST